MGVASPHLWIKFSVSVPSFAAFLQRSLHLLLQSEAKG